MESIATSLKRLADGGDARQLLIEELGFDDADEPVFFDAQHAHLERAFPSVRKVAEKRGLSVIHLQGQSDGRLGKQLERVAIRRLKARYPLAWFIFSDASGRLWHFVNMKKEAVASGGANRLVLRRMEIAPEVANRLRTSVERLAMIRDGLAACANASEVQSLLDRGFDVEAVGKDFFGGYKEHFWRLVDAVIEHNKGKAWFMGEDGEINARHYAMLLMGRILFLHFIQRKGWLNGEQDFLAGRLNRFRNDPAGTGFLWDVLFPLFFEGLAVPGEEKRIGSEICRIPFLNGGLFEPHEDFREADELERPLIPNRLFLDFFAFLGRYNFTIAESTPLDQEVGVDPEMLGKVFENLLAKEDRHATGTYYTPRTIVSFMCRESLFQYLQGKAGLDRAQFRALLDHVWHGQPEGVDEDVCRRVLDALESVRVLDPAIGSGAFPLGMLHELVELKVACKRLLGESEESLLANMARLKTNTIERSLFGVDINVEACEIARLRLWLAMVVDEDAPTPLPNLDYHIVQGDTLREKLDGEPILPPRIEQADSGLAEQQTALPGLGAPQLSLGTTVGERARHTVNIIRALHEFYAASDAREKRRLKEEIETSLKAILNEHWDEKERHFNAEIDAVLEQAMQVGRDRTSLPRNWEKRLRVAEDGLQRIQEEREALEKDGRWPVTPLRLFFADVFAGSNPGFDIVIANPPYVRQEVIKPIKPQLKEEFGEFFASTADLYTYFYARGLDLLRQGGVLCFIAPNKFMRAGYGKNTRRLLARQAAPRIVIDFGDLPIFEATTYPSIVMVEKAAPDERDEARAAVFTEDAQIEHVEETLDAIGFPMPVAALKEDGWTLERPEVLALMEKLRERGTPLGEYVQGRFYRGVLTGLNEAFVIDEATRRRLIGEDPNSADIIRPWLRGRDIRKWKADWAGLYVIFSRRGTDIDRYPAIKRHLERFREDLEPKTSPSQRRGRKPGLYKWFEIQDNIAYYAEFERPKVVYADIAKHMRASYDTTGSFAANTMYIVPTDDLSLLAFLNSKLFDWFARQNFQCLGNPWQGGRLRFIAQYMKTVPIIPASDLQKAPIIERVEAILAAPQAPDVPHFESEIDDLVYRLYGLNEAEIAIVEDRNE